LNDLAEDETFCIGVAVGISLHQQKVIAAHERREYLKNTLYYLQDGRERLQEMFDKICR